MTLLNTSELKYKFTNHDKIVTQINKEARPFYTSLYRHYNDFCLLARSHGIDVSGLYVSDFGFRPRKNSSDNGAHHQGLAIDVCRPEISGSLSRIALFGFYLQTVTNWHVAISMHNKHIHLDILPGRTGWKNVEYRDGNKYWFEPLTEDRKKKILKDYEFTKADINFMKTFKKNNDGFFVALIILLCVVAGLVLVGGNK